MMAIYGYVEQILSSPVYVFDEIIDKIIGKNIHYARIELSRYTFEVDTVLLESIKSILSDLDKEEGFVSRFLYSNFGFQFRKNKRREQLVYLGSELKTQHSKMKARLDLLEQHKERLLFCLTDLKRLVDGFKEKNFFFEDDKLQNKALFYVNELNSRIEEIEEVHCALEMKYNDLKEVENIYSRVFKKIPRCHLLQEEAHIMLALPAKV